MPNLYIKKRGYGLVFFTAILCFFFLNAYAQNDEKGDFKYETDSYLRYIAPRSLKAQPGKVQVTNSEVDFKYKLKLFDELPVDLSVSPGYVNINKTKALAVDLPAHLTGFCTYIQTTLPFFNLEHAYFRLGASPSFYGSNWTFEAKNFRIPSRYYAIYQPNDKWTYVGGVAVYPKYENSVLPILGFIYKASEKLVFSIVPESPNVSYALTDRMTLFVKGDGSANEFVVNRDNAQDVVLRYTQLNLGGGVRFKVNKFIQTSWSGGGVFNHALKYRDSGGKASINNGLFTEFRIEANI